MTGDMAETSVTDFTLPKLGRVSGFTNVWTWTYLKSGRVDRPEIDPFDNGASFNLDNEWMNMP